MEAESVFWLGLMIVLLVIELATMGLTTIWFAGGSLAAFIDGERTVVAPDYLVFWRIHSSADFHKTVCCPLYQQKSGSDECGQPDWENRDCDRRNFESGKPRAGTDSGADLDSTFGKRRSNDETGRKSGG